MTRMSAESTQAAPCRPLARIVRTMNRDRTRLPRLLAAIGLALWMVSAAALTPELQAELDRAVLDYEAGRHAQAQAEFESLARRQVPAAQYNLAVMHLRGELPQADRQLAGQLLLQAAEGGFVTAQFMLGQAHETGQFGPRDLVQANRWYAIAAGNGSVEAQVAMGTAFYLGRGARKDYAEAARWYREAAKGGDVGAQYLLASMYEAGDGVERDLRLARYWYDIAAKNGDEAAPGKVRQMDAELASTPS
jgi:TPR repeat protein